MALLLQPQSAISARHRAKALTDALGEELLAEATETARRGSIARIVASKPVYISFGDECTDRHSVVTELRRLIAKEPVKVTTTYVIFLTSVGHYVGSCDEETAEKLQQVTAALSEAAYVCSPNPLAVLTLQDFKFQNLRAQRKFERDMIQFGVWFLQLPFTRAKLISDSGEVSRLYSSALIHQFVSFVYLQHTARNNVLSPCISHYNAYNLFAIAEAIRALDAKPARHNAVTKARFQDGINQIALELNSLSIEYKLQNGQSHVDELVNRMKNLFQNDGSRMEWTDKPAHCGLHDQATNVN